MSQEVSQEANNGLPHSCLPKRLSPLAPDVLQRLGILQSPNTLQPPDTSQPPGTRDNPWGLAGINHDLEIDTPVPDVQVFGYPIPELPVFPYRGPYFPPPINPGASGFKQYSGQRRQEFMDSFLNRVTLSNGIPLREKFDEYFAGLFWDMRVKRMEVEREMRKKGYRLSRWDPDDPPDNEQGPRPQQSVSGEQGEEYSSGDTTIPDTGPAPKRPALMHPPRGRGQVPRGNRGYRGAHGPELPTQLRRSPRDHSKNEPQTFSFGRGGTNPYGRGRGGPAA